MSMYPVLIELLARYVTGNLLTDSQIKSITSNIVGKYFNDFFPISQQEADAENRISAARIHITEASKIINGLQDELEGQVLQLDALAKEIEDKKKLAERYELLAQTNQETFSAFRSELEESLRKELIAQSQEGKRVRIVVNIVIWIFTLILGAALGAILEISFEPFFQVMLLF